MRRRRRPSVTIATSDVDRQRRFFAAIGWPADERDPTVIVTPGGRFGLRHDDAPPRLELALSVDEPLQVDEIVDAVEPAGGLLMEPPQETAYGGWGCSFNDPDGNTWELGAPWTVTAIDVRMTTGAQPSRGDGPLVALAVLPRTASGSRRPARP